jgi:hypothetical protein
MFDASTATRVIGHPMRSTRADNKATGVGTGDIVEAGAKQPTNQERRSAAWWERHNYEFQVYKGIFGGR